MPDILGSDASPTTALFTVDVETDGEDCCRLRARGELDAAAVGILSAALHDPAWPRRRFVSLDLSAVTFCDAAGLSALLSAHQDFAARGGRLVLCEVPPGVRRVMHIVGLDAVLFDPLAAGRAPQDHRRRRDASGRARHRRAVAVADAATKEP
jgi:anti-anti-sigma factor